ncbi:MAG: biopolymer transport protein ExbD [Verrucomicrobiales bacterium]|jgi:biopolymer transport protein ExbD
MASNKLAAAQSAPQDAMKMDMSPMIDMVFLLLIFFMIASQMITVKMDPEVLPPVADLAVTGKIFKGRFVVNVYQDGTFKDVNFEPITEDQITERIRKVAEQLKNTDTPAKLHLRADRLAPVLSIKKVTKAAGAGGVNTVIFSSYSTSRGDPTRPSEKD